MSRLHSATAVVAALFLASSVFSGTVALRLLLLATGIVLAAVVVSTRHARGLPPIWLPFLLWGGWALASMAWSLEPDRTLKEWRNEVIYAGAAIWVCYVGAQARAALRIFIPILTLAGVLAATLSIRDAFKGPAHYALGWHGGPGDHSSALLCLMAGALALAWHAARARWRTHSRTAIWLLIALLAASAYATLNRTIWFGFALQFIAAGALALWWQARLENRALPVRTAMVASVGAMAVLTAAAGVMLHVHVAKEGDRAPDAKGDSRIAVWREISERIAERPILGHGFGRGIQAASIRKDLDDSGNLWHAHNLLLDTMLQTGVLGLALFLFLLARIAQQAWRLVRAQDPLAVACGLALVGVLIGMLTRNMTDTLLLRQNALLFWGLVGVLLVSSSGSGLGKSPPSRS